MDFVNLPLFAAAALVFLSVVSGLFSTRIGFSFLLVFLLAGALAGEDGPGGLQFDDFTLSFWVGNVALAVILLDGGLRTSYSTFRTGLKPSLLLATIGVAISALSTSTTRLRSTEAITLSRMSVMIEPRASARGRMHPSRKHASIEASHGKAVSRAVVA